MEKRMITYGKRDRRIDSQFSEAGKITDAASSLPTQKTRKRKLEELAGSETVERSDDVRTPAELSLKTPKNHEGPRQAVKDDDPWEYEDTSRAKSANTNPISRMRGTNAPISETPEAKPSFPRHRQDTGVINHKISPPTITTTNDLSLRSQARRDQSASEDTWVHENPKTGTKLASVRSTPSRRSGKLSLTQNTHKLTQSPTTSQDSKGSGMPRARGQAKLMESPSRDKLNQLGKAPGRAVPDKTQEVPDNGSEADSVPSSDALQLPDGWLKTIAQNPGSGHQRKKLRLRMDYNDLSRNTDRSGEEPETPNPDSPLMSALSSIDSQDGIAETSTLQATNNSQTSLIAENGLKKKTTYAGSRSFLAASQSATDDPFSLENLKDSFDFPSTSDSQNQHSSKRQQGPTILDDDEDDKSSGLKGLHELRMAGGQARQRRELESILDELDNINRASDTEKRATLLNIVSKLVKPDVLELFVQRNGFSKFLSQMKETSGADDLALFLLPLTIAISSERLFNVVVHSTANRDFFCLLIRASSGVSEKALSDKASKAVAISGRLINWGDDSHEDASIRNMSALCLRNLVTKTTFISDLTEADKQKSLDDICAILVPLLTSSATKRDAAAFQTMNLLEAIAIISATMPHTMKKRETSPMIQMAVSIVDNHIERDFRHRDEIWSCNLRLLLNITNENEFICTQICQNKILEAVAGTILHGFGHIQDPHPAQIAGSGMDDLVLALVLLLNISEFKRKDLASALMTDKADGPSWLQRFAEEFLTRAELAAETETQERALANVPLGYLSCLLCSLALDEGALLTLQQVGSKSVLSLLHSTAKDFLKFHQDVTEKTIETSNHGAEGEEESTGLFAMRMDVILDELSTKLSHR